MLPNYYAAKIVGELVFIILITYFALASVNILQRLNVNNWRRVASEGVSDFLSILVLVLLILLIQRGPSSISADVADTLGTVIYCLMVVFALRIAVIAVTLDKAIYPKRAQVSTQSKG